MNHSHIFRSLNDNYRVPFTFPLEAVMTIIEINKVKVNVGKSIVLIENMGPGGLRFRSNIKFPNNQGIVLGFEFYILNHSLNLCGQIIWPTEENEGIKHFEYELEFSINGADRANLMKLLNQPQIQLSYNSNQIVH